MSEEKRDYYNLINGYAEEAENQIGCAFDDLRFWQSEIEEGNVNDETLSQFKEIKDKLDDVKGWSSQVSEILNGLLYDLKDK